MVNVTTALCSAPFTRRRLVQGLATALLGGAWSSTWGQSQLGLGNRAEPDHTSTQRWAGPHEHRGGWLEWRLSAPSSWNSQATTNPFDAAQADIWVMFEGPGGQRVRTTAFWTQDVHGVGWVVRLLPAVVGAWRGKPFASIAAAKVVQEGTAFHFAVAQVPALQRIGIDPGHPAYFAFNDGSPFVPMGLNLGWPEGSPLDDYRRWFRRLAGNGGNFARIWMSSWSFGLEWKDTGLGDYRERMGRAEQLDRVFEMAEEYGIRIMLCLINHGAFTEKNDTEWKDNPYNAARGGPLTAPEHFVTDVRARALFARRLRYIAARWSHSPALHSWEWWNEITWTPIANADLLPWIQEMSAVLDRHDPYHRLRSTSWADRGDAKVWAMPEMDFAQVHDYTTHDLSSHYGTQYRAFRAEVPTKPLLAAELGLEPSFDAKAWTPFIWDTVHLHNGLWAPLFHGYAGTALYWWWDHLVDPQNLWPIYRGLSRFVAAVQTDNNRIANHRPHPAQFSGGPATALALVGERSLLLWVRADLHDVTALREAHQASNPTLKTPWTPPWKAISTGQVQCSQSHYKDGTARVRWIDPQTGEWHSTTSTRLTGGMLTLSCPTFERDLAAIVDWPGQHP